MAESPLLVSVIVPIHNAERWLPDSFHSWASQTYANIEWVLVDDGSTDKSAELCQAWCAEDTACRHLFRKKNGGASSARNYGLKQAAGQYVAFWDADDTQDPEMVEAMVASITSENADVVICALRRLEVNGREHHLYGCIPHSSSSESALEEWLGGKCSTGPYSKLIARRLLVENGIEFEEGVINEDVLWTAEVIGASSSIYFLGVPLYTYTARPGSITVSFGPQVLDVLSNCKKLTSYINDVFPYCSRVSKAYCAQECWGIALASARGNNRRRYPAIYSTFRQELKRQKNVLPPARGLKEQLLRILYWTGLYQIIKLNSQPECG